MLQGPGKTFSCATLSWYAIFFRSCIPALESNASFWYQGSCASFFFHKFLVLFLRKHDRFSVIAVGYTVVPKFYPLHCPLELE